MNRKDKKQRLKNEKKAAPAKKKKHIVKRLLKVFIITGLFLAVLLIVLANLGGNRNGLKDIVTDILAESSGYSVNIETLNNVSFFPNLGFDFERVTFYETEEKKTAVASLERAFLYFSLWDVLISKGQVKAMEIKNLEARAGIFWEQAFKITSLSLIDGSKEGEAFMEGHGFINGIPAHAKIAMALTGQNYGKRYHLPYKRRIEASLGNISLKAKQDASINAALWDTTFALNDVDMVKSIFTLGSSEERVHVDGQATLLERESDLDINLVFLKKQGDTPPTLTGSIKSSVFHLEDLQSKSNLMILIPEIQKLAKAFEKAPEKTPALKNDFALGALDLDLNLDFKDLRFNDQSLASLKTPVSLKDGHLKINKAAGSISDGWFNLDIDFNTGADTPTFESDLAIRDFDYGALQIALLGQAEVTGRLNVTTHLTGEGRNAASLLQSLKGKATMVSGEGQFTSGTLNLWGGGLINALMPDFKGKSEELKLNCAIFDFGIENGIAQAKTLFADGAHVTIIGEGSYDIATDNLDLTLKPKSKSISLGDLSVPVRIQGPLSAPSIGGDIIDIGARLGGLVLGVINPAFLAFTLTDLGLGEEHPCSGFIEGSATPKETPQEPKIRETNQ